MVSSKSKWYESKLEISNLNKSRSDLKKEIEDCYSKLEVKETEVLKETEHCKKVQNEIKSLKKEIPIIEEELQTWKQERNEMEKNPRLSEDLEIWNEEIRKIEISLHEKVQESHSKEKELQEIKKAIETLQINIKDMKKVLNGKKKDKTEINDLISKKSQELIKYAFKSLENFSEPSDLIRFIKDIKSMADASEVDLTSFLKMAKSYGLKLNSKILDASYKVFDVRNSLNIPNYITEFILSCIDEIKATDILELWPKLGSFLGPLTSKFYESQITAIIKDNNESELVKTVYTDKNIVWQCDESQHFNTILTFEPHINNHEDILKVLKKLKNGGKGFIVLNKDFLIKREKGSLLNELKKFELSVEAVFNLPDLEVQDAVLAVIKPGKAQKLFIGELTLNSKDILLKNFKKCIEGKIPQYGAFTELESFFSFKSFFAQYESRELAKNEGLKSLKLSEICEEINLPHEKGFIEKPNSIYLSIKDLTTDPTTLLEDLDDQKCYAQLVLDPKKALAEYVKRFFYTPLGQKVRESLSFESYTPEIYRKIIENTDFYIPTIDEQVEILSVDSKINDITTKANSIKSRLWKKPKNVGDLLKEIESMGNGRSEQNLEDWIESLPFPLASILWANITNPEYERKVKYLLQFFEAFSEFQVALMLSGLSSDPDFFEMEIAYELEGHNKIRDWYLKPTFGNWTYVGRTLAYQIRRLLRHNNTRYECLKLFGNPDIEFLEYLGDDELYKMLHEISNYRNQWEGHGPIVSENDYHNRHKILRTYLSKLYEKTVNLYENTFLILPIQSTFKDGVHNYTVQKFMSTRPPFKPLKVETTSLMDSNKVYLISQNQRTPIELLPFIYVQNDSCYFYNDYDEKNDSTRFVSYHYTGEPEIFLPNDKVNALNRILKVF